MTRTSPCLGCGACCAAYAVTFDRAEADDVLGGKVPVALVLSPDKGYRTMIGTDLHHPRCIALQGCVGTRVLCSIYENRSSICRNFLFSGENGRDNLLCDRARNLYGLEPLVSSAF